MTEPPTDIVERIDVWFSDELPLTGTPCKHGYDLAICPAKECDNPFVAETILADAKAEITRLRSELQEARETSCEFRFFSGPWENSELPTIVRTDPDGGDPFILATLCRVHRPDDLYELCDRANRAVPEGWQLVPKEPTQAMIAAMDEAWANFTNDASDIYRTILAAAPSPTGTVKAESEA